MAELMQYDPGDHQRRVKAEVARRGLGSLMNDTKWHELVAAIDELPFAPPYQRKDVMHAQPEPASFDEDVSYTGDWIEGIHPFFSIEWVRIRPRYLRHVARLLPPETVDCEAELELTLQSLGQPYEKVGDSIWIYGYR